MGRQDVAPNLDPATLRAFTRSLLTDLRALEHLLQEGAFETGVRRIGAEQELFLVNRGWRPAPVAPELLKDLQGPEFTTELARFNLEMNLEPLRLQSGCFNRLEERLDQLIDRVRTEAQKHRADVVLTGILPTLTKSDLSLENITPRARYHALNEALSRMCRGCYRVYIQGTDELHLEHDSVMLEGGNTSFQIHLQVEPHEFARFYNIAQAISAPLLACAVNSPLLFGRRLWEETRIALFQRAMDTRVATPHVREFTARVRFGERWVRSSVLEMYQEDVARVPALLGCLVTEDSLRVVHAGGIPDLTALQLYNSTVYRWNRGCYGITEGKPHLRIECRVLPAGPTVLDEVANAAFWIGLLLGGTAEWGDVTERMDFDDARANFLAAARRGLKAGFTWSEGKAISAPVLILEELLPLADRGLASAGIEAEERRRYLDVIAARVSSGVTGAQWLERSLVRMGASGTRAERLAALTAATARQQWTGKPGHQWEPATIGEGGGWRYNYLRVEQYMTTDLFTVKEDEVVDLAALVMDWKRIRQIPVEDDQHRLVGLVSFGAVLRLLAAGRSEDNATVPVKTIMDPHPITINPETSTLEAIRIMREHHVTSLPVVKDRKLVGIVSVDDFAPIAERLLEEKLEDQ